MFSAQVPGPDPASVQQSMRSQQSESVPFEEYFAPETKTSAGELVPDPSSENRHDTTPTVLEASLLVLEAAEALHLNLELHHYWCTTWWGLERDRGF